MKGDCSGRSAGAVAFPDLPQRRSTRKLVGDVLGRIEQFPDFDPRKHCALTVNATELTREEQGARGAVDPEEVELEL